MTRERAVAGLVAPLYRSGSRLKIRWAEPPSAGAAARVPYAVFATKLGRDCELDYGPGDHACIPVAGKRPTMEELA